MTAACHPGAIPSRDRFRESCFLSSGGRPLRASDKGDGSLSQLLQPAFVLIGTLDHCHSACHGNNHARNRARVSSKAA
jgi:hypothetical protein